VTNPSLKISAWAQAEKDNAQLESLAYSLQLLASGEEDYTALSLPLYPIAPAKDVWKSWILRESARRTFLICFFFLSVYHLLKGRGHYCDQHPPVTTTWTSSAHLWQAHAVFDFAVAWKEKRHFVVKDLDYTELLAEASPDDIDSFGRILLVAHMGIDDTRGWFYTRGGYI
jgi:hypothetical protein